MLGWCGVVWCGVRCVCSVWWGVCVSEGEGVCVFVCVCVCVRACICVCAWVRVLGSGVVGWPYSEVGQV